MVGFSSPKTDTIHKILRRFDCNHISFDWREFSLLFIQIAAAWFGENRTKLVDTISKRQTHLLVLMCIEAGHTRFRTSYQLTQFLKAGKATLIGFSNSNRNTLT